MAAGGGAWQLSRGCGLTKARAFAVIQSCGPAGGRASKLAGVNPVPQTLINQKITHNLFGQTSKTQMLFLLALRKSEQKIQEKYTKFVSEPTEKNNAVSVFSKP